ncbi:MAG: hypothetical protein JXB48_23345 [Candidatus Latescibacteria bacterium]|nr:hypothetical protein [Candidatus Latescibacterota bacterium]
MTPLRRQFIGALRIKGFSERTIENKEGCLTVQRESDQLIVLGERESRSHAFAEPRLCRHGEGAEATRILLRTSRKKVRRLILDLKQWIKDHMSKRLKWIMGMVKTKLRGPYNYFKIIGNSGKFEGDIYSLLSDVVPVAQSSIPTKKL